MHGPAASNAPARRFKVAPHTLCTPRRCRACHAVPCAGTPWDDIGYWLPLLAMTDRVPLLLPRAHDTLLRLAVLSLAATAGDSAGEYCPLTATAPGQRLLLHPLTGQLSKESWGAIMAGFLSAANARISALQARGRVGGRAGGRAVPFPASPEFFCSSPPLDACMLACLQGKSVGCPSGTFPPFLIALFALLREHPQSRTHGQNHLRADKVQPLGMYRQLFAVCYATALPTCPCLQAGERYGADKVTEFCEVGANLGLPPELAPMPAQSHTVRL